MVSRRGGILLAAVALVVIVVVAAVVAVRVRQASSGVSDRLPAAPDGQLIVAAHDPGSGSSAAVVDWSGHLRARLRAPAAFPDVLPVQAPDGSAVVAGLQVITADDAGRLHDLFPGNPEITGDSQLAVRWSEDGRYLCALRIVGGAVEVDALARRASRARRIAVVGPDQPAAGRPDLLACSAANDRVLLAIGRTEVRELGFRDGRVLQRIALGGLPAPDTDPEFRHAVASPDARLVGVTDAIHQRSIILEAATGRPVTTVPVQALGFSSAGDGVVGLVTSTPELALVDLASGRTRSSAPAPDRDSAYVTVARPGGAELGIQGSDNRGGTDAWIAGADGRLVRVVTGGRLQAG